MASPPLRGSPEWSAKREVEVLLGLTRGNHYRAQQLSAPKKTRGAAAVQAALAAAAPPITAENYATYALAAANPHPPSA